MYYFDVNINPPINITAAGQGDYVDIDFTSIEVELVTDIIPPVDWLPNKYRYIDNEWVINN